MGEGLKVGADIPYEGHGRAWVHAGDGSSVTLMRPSAVNKIFIYHGYVVLFDFRQVNRFVRCHSRNTALYLKEYSKRLQRSTDGMVVVRVKVGCC